MDDYTKYTIQSMLFTDIINFLRKHLLVICTVSAVFLGLAIGSSLRQTYIPPWVLILIEFPGELFMNMLRCLILPLIAFSLLTACAQLDPKLSGKIGKWGLTYYMVTTFIAVLTGIIMVKCLRPGIISQKTLLNAALNKNLTNISSVNTSSTKNGNLLKETTSTTLDAIMDLVRNLFPENIVKATFQSQRTIYEPIKSDSNITEANIDKNITRIPSLPYKRKVVYEDVMNTLGIIVFSMAFGSILCRQPVSADPGKSIVITSFVIINDIIMILVEYMMWYSPIGILSLVTAKVLSIINLKVALSNLGLYVSAVVSGLAIHVFVTTPLIYWMFTRKNPFVFMRGLTQALLTALATASSSATLPFTIQCTERNNGIDKRITRFLLPIGATINMDGTALYEAVAAVFIANFNGKVLSLGQLLTLSITATFASIGAAAIPGAGLVTMVMVLNSVGLPVNDIAVLLPVDWLLDRFRTCVNVLGDAFGCGVIQQICLKTLSLDHGANDHSNSDMSLADDIPPTKKVKTPPPVSSPTKRKSLNLVTNNNINKKEKFQP